MRLHRATNSKLVTGTAAGNWLVGNVGWLKSLMRVVLGIVWLIDGYFKFQPGVIEYVQVILRSAGQGQPSWLQPWFTFWANATSGKAALFVYGTGTLELVLGAVLVLGFMRKVAYLGGIILSLLIWSVPEGFGGPYGPGSIDIGTGIIYSFVFVSLIIINAAFGPSKYSLDFVIERRYPAWKRLAEFG